MNWSPQQAELFRLFVGPLPAGATVRPGPRHVLVRARAGTGKTTSIEELVRQVLAKWPRLKVLCCAFGKDIAAELTRRLPKSAEARTLHSLGFEAQKDGRPLKVQGERSRRLAAEVCGLAEKEVVKVVEALATLGKECLPLATGPDDLVTLQADFDLFPDEEAREDAAWVRARAFEAMVLALEYDGTVSFPDMVYRAVRLNLARPRYDLLIVDEAQDMNWGQLLLALKLVKPTGRILIVGDDRQGIYEFRGAAPGALDKLKERLEAVEVPLTVTRRCPKAVVALAAQLVPDFTASPDAPEGEVLGLPEAELLGAVAPGDFVLSRTNAPLVATCLRLIARKVPARIRGKDLAEGLVDLIQKAKAQSLGELDQYLERWAAKQRKRAAKLTEARQERVLTETDDKLEALRALMDSSNGVLELIASIKLLFADPEVPSVVLSTVHKAKGLEADRVFLLERTFTRQGEEEDNIRYVALTRAKKTLTLVTE